MRRPDFLSSVAFSAAAALVALLAGDACESATVSPLGEADAGFDAALAPPSAYDAAPADAGIADAAPDAPALSTTLRLVHLAPGLPPFDLCYRVGLGSWRGPLLASLDDADTDGGAGDAEAGAPPGVSFATSSPFLTLPTAGTFEVALVAAGNLSCANGLATGQVTLAAGKRATVVVMGAPNTDAAASALRVVAFTDDATPAVASARVRFVNAALGDATSSAAGPLVVSLSAPPTTAVLAADVAPGSAATPSATPPLVDALGYASTPPISSPATLSLVPAAEADAESPARATPSEDLGLSIGSVHTGFILSNGLGGVAILWCDDEDAACGVLSAQ